MTEQCLARCKYLADSLPATYQPAIQSVEAALPALLDKSYPAVLTHGDFNEMNILVDPESGKIRGIVDWSEASVLPFGFALYGLENILGSMGPGGWKWSENAGRLRKAFWDEFRKHTTVSESQMPLIYVAAKAGILFRYGTAFDSGFAGMVGTRDPADDDLTYLNILLSGPEENTISPVATTAAKGQPIDET